MYFLIGVLLTIASVSALAQPPFVYYRGVANAAGAMPQVLPGGGIARGSLFAINGRNLGPASSPPIAFPLQQTLGGVSITVSTPSASVNAIPILVGPSQIIAIMPSNAPLGSVTLRLVYNNARANPAPITVVASAPGIFTVNDSGIGPGILENVVPVDQINQPRVKLARSSRHASAGSGTGTALSILQQFFTNPMNSLQEVATRSQVIRLWGTGLGPVTFPDNLAPVKGSLPIKTEVLVAGKPAKVLYSGRNECCAAVDTIEFEVPSDAPNGCWVPVYVRTAGANVSNTVTMAIADESGGCGEPANPLATALVNGGSIASYFAARLSVRHDIGVLQPREALSEFAAGWLASEQPLPFNFNPLFSLPPPGACSAYATAGQLAVNTTLPGMTPPTGRPLSGGLGTLSGLKGSRLFVPGGFPGTVVTWLSGAISGISPFDRNYLNPGTYTLSTTGGTDVGAINASLDVGQPLTWTNRDQLATIDRSRGFSVSWTGAGDDQVLIAGGGSDLPGNASAVFVCLANSGDTSFTVPPDVLANIAPARARLIQSPGAVYVGSLPLANPPILTASGIDSGVLLPLLVSGKTVTFR